MAIKVDVTIKDEGIVDSRALVGLLNHIDLVARWAGAEAARQFGRERGLADVIGDAAAFRILSYPEGIFWIEELSYGSKRIVGVIMGAVLTAIINNTVGESIKEGWKQTDTHAKISESIPKVEAFVVDRFKYWFLEGETNPARSEFSFEPLGVERKEDDWVIYLRASPKRLKPLVDRTPKE